jgi:hypothetical protein
LVKKRTLGGESCWTETSALKQDFDQGLICFEELPVEPDDPNHPLAELVHELDGLHNIAENLWIYIDLARRLLCYSYTSDRVFGDTCDDAIRRSCRLCYSEVVTLVANLWDLADNGKVVRREGKFGAEWAPPPRDFSGISTTKRKAISVY